MITLYIARDKRVTTYPGNLQTERIFNGLCLRTHKAEEITCIIIETLFMYILTGYKPLDKINVHKKNPNFFQSFSLSIACTCKSELTVILLLLKELTSCCCRSRASFNCAISWRS